MICQVCSGWQSEQITTGTHLKTCRGCERMLMTPRKCSVNQVCAGMVDASLRWLRTRLKIKDIKVGWIVRSVLVLATAMASLLPYHT